MLNIQEIMTALTLYHKDPVLYQGNDEVYCPELIAWLTKDEDRAKDFLQKCTDQDLFTVSCAFDDLAQTFGAEFIQWLTDLCAGRPLDDWTKNELDSARWVCGLDK